MSEKLNAIFDTFKQIKALIIGDVMVDSYAWGKVERISPEAPVPVLHVQKKEHRLGGAANVALNIKSLGATPVLVAVCGQDSAGNSLCQLLEKEGIATSGIVKSSHRPTTIKHRVMSGSHHLIRVDDETDELLNQEENTAIKAAIAKLLPDCHVIVFEDYDKGMLSEDLIAYTISLARQHNIPTIVDPKKRNFLYYSGVTLFKPNLKELREGLKIDIGKPTFENLAETANTLRDKMKVAGSLLTLSEHGMFVDHENEQHLAQAWHRNIADVSGAGDTVVSIAALCLAAKTTPLILLQLANLGGGLVCEYPGVVPIDRLKLLDEAKRLGLG